MRIQLVTEKDIDSIMSIYHSLIGRPGCTWDEGYPTAEIVLKDIKTNCLYGMYDEKNTIIGVTAAGTTDDLKDMTCWSREIKNPAFLGRIGIIPSMQNCGYAYQLIQTVSEELIGRGFDGIHFLVSKTNPSAIALYKKCGFSCCGETFEYDIDWYCYEKKL